jgi:hypothetical protein
MLRPFYSRENRLKYPLNKTLELVWIFWVDEISCLHIESNHDSSVFHPVGKSVYWLYSAGCIETLFGKAYCWYALCFIYIYIYVCFPVNILLWMSNVLPAVIEQGWPKCGPPTSLVLIAQLAYTDNNIQANLRSSWLLGSIGYQRFGTTFRSHLPRSNSPRRMDYFALECQ